MTHKPVRGYHYASWENDADSRDLSRADYVQGVETQQGRSVTDKQNTVLDQFEKNGIFRAPEGVTTYLDKKGVKRNREDETGRFFKGNFKL